MLPSHTTDEILGRLLVSRGLLQPRQLDEALKLQARSTPRPRLLEVLVASGHVTPTTAHALDLELTREPSAAAVLSQSVPWAQEEAGAVLSQSVPWAQEPTASRTQAPEGATAPPARALPPDVERARADSRRLLADRYVLVDQLGRGGFGAVYRAWDLRLQREVAVKVLEQHDQRAWQRFERELQAGARLNHPSIVAVHDAGEANGRPFLVMDLVRGVSLDRLEPRPDVTRSVILLRDVARAVAHAHGHGVLHRDLKPQNIVVDAVGAPHVLDFGLARLTDQVGAPLTRTGHALGTALYMPPEQAAGERDRIDERSDLYALGATLFHLLAGEPPFKGASATEVLYAVLQKRPKPPSTLNSAIPRDLDAIVLRCLEKEPHQRYLSAVHLADDLDRFLNGEPLLARPVSTLERFARLVRRRKALATGAAVAMATIAGLGTAFVRARLGEAQAQRDVDVGRDTAAKERAKERERADAERAATEAERASAAQEAGRALAARRTELERVLASVAASPVATPSAEEEAVAALSRHREQQTVELLLGAVGSIDSELCLAAREVILEANTPEADEQGQFPGLAEAFDRAWTGIPPAEDAPAPLVGAAVRIEVRLARRATASRSSLTLRGRLAAAEDRRLGPGGTALSRVVCAALWRLGEVGDVAATRAALGRHLLLHHEEFRATAVGVALVKLGGGSDQTIQAARRRFGANSVFWSRVAPLLGNGQRAGTVPETADALFVNGQALLERGSFDEAIADLERAVALDERHGSAWKVLGVAHARRGAFPQALAALERALTLAPTDAGTFVNRAVVRRELGNVDGAEADLKRAIELAPSHAGAWSTLGTLQSDRGDMAQAVESYGRALELNPNAPMLWANRAGVREAQGDWEGAVADASRAIELHPDGPQPWAVRARARIHLGEPDAALVDAERAVSLGPLDADAHYARGLCRFHRGEFEQAAADFDRAVDLAPDSASAVEARGDVRQALGDREGALADFERSLVLEPNRASALSGRGLERYFRGELDNAEKDFSRAVELDGGDAAAWGNRGMVRLARGDGKGAADDYARAAQLDPSNATIVAGLGEARLALGDAEGAIRESTRAITLNEANADAWSVRGAARSAKGEHRAGLADADRAVELMPGLAMAWERRAAIRVALGDKQGARADLDRVLELDATMASAWLARGRLRADLGDREGARQDLDRCIALAPAGPHAASANEALHRLKTR